MRYMLDRRSFCASNFYNMMKTLPTFLDCFLCLWLIIAQCVVVLSVYGSKMNITFLANKTIYTPNTYLFTPSICGVNNTMVVVYESQPTLDSMNYTEYDGTLNYVLYKVESNGSFIKVGGDIYTEGHSPFITAHPSSSMVIAVNEDQSRKFLYYHVGQVIGNTIKWKTPPGGILYVKEGAVASISVNKKGIVFATHKRAHAPYDDSVYYYCIGYFDTISAKISWQGNSTDGLCTPPSDIVKGWTPRVQITNKGTVVIVSSISWKNLGMQYTIGKLTAPSNDNFTIKWVANEVKYSNCSGFNCPQAGIAVDSSGTVFEVHCAEGYTTIFNELYYRIGILHDKHIQWKHSVRFGSDGGALPAIAFLYGTSYMTLYGLVYLVPEVAINISTVALKFRLSVELVNIAYGTAIPHEEVLFDRMPVIAKFENNGPCTQNQTWKVRADYYCTNTHSWDVSTSLPAGISVRAKISYFVASALATTEYSTDFTIGRLHSKTEKFSWEQDEQVIIPPQVGNVTYYAEIYRVPHTIPFVATFKRGPFTWKETGTVSVTHGSIFTHIYTSNKTTSRI